MLILIQMVPDPDLEVEEAFQKGGCALRAPVCRGDLRSCSFSNFGCTGVAYHSIHGAALPRCVAALMAGKCQEDNCRASVRKSERTGERNLMKLQFTGSSFG